MVSIVAALRRHPFGQRLAKHVHRILAGDLPVTREEVLQADKQCVCLYDWVHEMTAPLLNLPDSQSASPDSPTLDAAESQDDRSAAVVAVSEQEKEVARLRRKLREAERSEQAAADFASENDPAGVPIEASSNRNESPASPELPELPEELREELEVTGQKSLQYRLEEVSVPATQEAVLRSLVKTLLEPRAGSKRCLEIVGHAEDREDAEIAKERAEAAKAWLLSCGVPPERLIAVRWEAGGPSICRRTDLRLLEPVGADSAMRQKAAELMKRIFAGRAGLVEGEGPNSRAEQCGTSGSNMPGDTKECQKDMEAVAAQPSYNLEESFDSATQRRQLRLVFRKAADSSKCFRAMKQAT